MHLCKQTNTCPASFLHTNEYPVCAEVSKHLRLVLCLCSTVDGDVTEDNKTKEGEHQQHWHPGSPRHPHDEGHQRTPPTRQLDTRRPDQSWKDSYRSPQFQKTRVADTSSPDPAREQSPSTAWGPAQDPTWLQTRAMAPKKDPDHTQNNHRLALTSRE